MTDQAIHEMMTAIKDSWHHFNRDDIEGSLKSVAGRVFYIIKKYSNPDLDVEAMTKRTWNTQDHMGSGQWYPTQEEEDEFNEYVANWKYPRKESK